MSCENCTCDEEIEVISERVRQWREYSNRVEKHLNEYTVPQYGDVGEDAITEYTVKDCAKHVERYAKRYGTQSRDGQQELDFLKMGHYSQCAWEKYVNGVSVSPTEQTKIVLSYTTHDDKKLSEMGFTFDGMTYDSDEKEVHIWKLKE